MNQERAGIVCNPGIVRSLDSYRMFSEIASRFVLYRVSEIDITFAK